MANVIQPDQLKTALNDGQEFALLDVRERGQYARAHLFLAINLPLSILELRIRRYVPRLSARVLLCDQENGFAERAAHVMQAAGYNNISVIAGGVYNCVRAGFELFRGHYAVTYAFGLYVGQQYQTPEISPQSLKAKVDAGEPLVLLDSRNIDEFRHVSIPGTINVPLAELPYRVHDLAPDPKTQVIVNCGAITRGVLGGQSLVEAGVENPVSVLTNGVRGWDLAGFELQRGATATVGPVSSDSAAWAAKSARQLADAVDVKFIGDAELDQWRNDQERTLYIVDVRTKKEYESGHIKDALWILGGELVGLYEDHIGTLNARVCLVDDNGARAILTAGWLNRMGWPDVAVLQEGMGGMEKDDLIVGPEPQTIPELDSANVTNIGPAELVRQIESDNLLVIDFASSGSYELGHIPGAWWTLRSNLPDLVSKFPATDKLVTTSPDGRLATFAAMDLKRLTEIPVMVLDGGTDAWSACGYELVGGMTRTLGEIDDVAAEFRISANDDRETILAAQRRMLQWQQGLLGKLERDDTFSFPDLPAVNTPG